MPPNPVAQAREKAEIFEAIAKEARLLTILAALEQAKGSRKDARAILGVSPRQMARYVKEHKARIDELCREKGFVVRPYHPPKPKRKRSDSVDPLTAKCPRCGADEKKPCSSIGQDSYARGAPLRRAHSERYRRAA